MTPPLSILLPVHNAQATLVADVARLLDVLPELTAWFDLVIIDDGSTDATCEIAEELVTEYPQVRLIRHAVRRGIEGSWRVGLQRIDAPVVLGHNGRAGIDPAAISSLLLNGEALGTSRDARRMMEPPTDLARLTASPNTIESDSRLVRWLSARALAEEPPAIGGFCLLRREAELPPVPRPNHRRIEPGHVVQATQPANEAKPAAPNPPPPIKPAIKPRPIPAGKVSAPRPSFLAKLQSLARGE